MKYYIFRNTDEVCCELVDCIDDNLCEAINEFKNRYGKTFTSYKEILSGDKMDKLMQYPAIVHYEDHDDEEEFEELFMILIPSEV